MHLLGRRPRSGPDIWYFGALLCAVLSLLGAAAAGLPPDAAAIDAAQAVRPAAVVRAITVLQNTPGQTRVTGTPGAEAGRGWLQQTLQSYGLGAQRWPFEVAHAFEAGHVATGVNLVLRMGPQDGAALVLLAHLDSKAAEDVPQALQLGWRWREDPAPGADDNASGAAALLEVARVLSERQDSLRRPIYLVWTDAEELASIEPDGFMQGYGAEHVAQGLAERGQAVGAALSLDMLARARPYGFLMRLYSDGRWASQELAQVVALCAQRVAPELVLDERVVPAFTWSDHAAFWALGQGGLLLIEDDFHHPRYHRTEDLYRPDEGYYDLGQALAATRLVAAVALLY